MGKTDVTKRLRQLVGVKEMGDRELKNCRLKMCSHKEATTVRGI